MANFDVSTMLISDFFGDKKARLDSYITQLKISKRHGVIIEYLRYSKNLNLHKFKPFALFIILDSI